MASVRSQRHWRVDLDIGLTRRVLRDQSVALRKSWRTPLQNFEGSAGIKQRGSGVDHQADAVHGQEGSRVSASCPAANQGLGVAHKSAVHGQMAVYRQPVGASSGATSAPVPTVRAGWRPAQYALHQGRLRSFVPIGGLNRWRRLATRRRPMTAGHLLTSRDNGTARQQAFHLSCAGDRGATLAPAELRRRKTFW